MRVLLISPLDPKVPQNLKLLMGGENTYTQMLLRYPPKGVTFIHFEEALKRKLVTCHWSQNFFLWLQKLRILPLGPRVQLLILKQHFDLVYAHAYPIKLQGIVPPLVISDSSSNLVFLEKYLKWQQWRIKFTQLVKLAVFKTFNIIDGEVNTDKAQGFFVFSKWAKKIKNLEFRIMNCEVIYPGLPMPKINKASSRLSLSRAKSRDSKNKLIKLLFVGVWFERKGGRILLQAFEKLHSKYSRIHLTILGQLPSDVSIHQNLQIIHKEFVSYRELLHHYQTHDVLVHVPPEIEGYGMTVPEAMSYGMIPAVSDICALPEFVDHKKNGLIVKAGSVVQLADALEALIENPTLRNNLSKNARAQFCKKFSLPVFQKRLIRVFKDAMTD